MLEGHRGIGELAVQAILSLSTWWLHRYTGRNHRRHISGYCLCTSTRHLPSKPVLDVVDITKVLFADEVVAAETTQAGAREGL